MEDEAVEAAAPPKDNAVYKTQAYWEERFRREAEYEWLVPLDAVWPLMEREGHAQVLCKPDAKVLVVGCGNSPFSAHLARKTGCKPLSIDFSQQVIQRMASKFPQLEWRVMDMCKMDELAPDSFDMVIDKAAMDALVTDEGDPWNPNEPTKAATCAMMTAVGRVLKPGALFCQISFQQPHFRKKYLAAAKWSNQDVAVRDIDHGMGYFFYSLRKETYVQTF